MKSTSFKISTLYYFKKMCGIFLEFLLSGSLLDLNNHLSHTQKYVCAHTHTHPCLKYCMPSLASHKQSNAQIHSHKDIGTEISIYPCTPVGTHR